MCRAQRVTINAGLLLTRGETAVCSAERWCTSAAHLTPPASTARTSTGPSLCPTAPALDRTMSGMSRNPVFLSFSHFVIFFTCMSIIFHNFIVLSFSVCSDYGFKLSEDLSLEVCVPDPEFSGNIYAPPVPCPVGTTYRRSKG